MLISVVAEDIGRAGMGMRVCFLAGGVKDAGPMDGTLDVGHDAWLKYVSGETSKEDSRVSGADCGGWCWPLELRSCSVSSVEYTDEDQESRGRGVD
jgi:hypothetical protein